MEAPILTITEESLINTPVRFTEADLRFLGEAGISPMCEEPLPKPPPDEGPDHDKRPGTWRHPDDPDHPDSPNNPDNQPEGGNGN